MNEPSGRPGHWPLAPLGLLGAEANTPQAQPEPWPARFRISEATRADREVISRIRHDVYAAELGQHALNVEFRLSDALDEFNIDLVAHLGAELVGFVSLTPPGGPSYSIDKYFARGALPFPCDAGLYESRLLTVPKSYRGRELAALLMYAAFRWVESHGGTRVVAIGRREILGFYERVGLVARGLRARSGMVWYELMEAPVSALRDRVESHPALVDRLERKADWRLSFPFRRPAPCFHGGASFGAIGENFKNLDRRHAVINADVLDAWFPPSPAVLDVFRDHLPWLLATSPPTGSEGLVEAISQARGVPGQAILPGAGSSDLIFLALRHWLARGSKVLILDPTYGEYAHVLERVIGCRVDRLSLRREAGYLPDLDRLEAALARGPDLAVIVNPNSPTGRHVPRADLETVLHGAPKRTRIWVDETYVEYAGPGQSLEAFAAASENVLVCKSMSKVYALSGARVAYLCGGRHQLEDLRTITPPWAVSLPAQVSAVRALEDPGYYARRHAETSSLREGLAGDLRELGWEIIPGVANFLLGHLPQPGPDAAALVALCRERGLFLRDAALMGTQLDRDAVRIAVKDAPTNARMVEILTDVAGRPSSSISRQARPTQG